MPVKGLFKSLLIIVRKYVLAGFQEAYDLRVVFGDELDDAGRGDAREPVDDLPLALVAPLRANDGDVAHV